MSFVVTAVVAAVELGTVAAIATAVTYVGVAMTVVGTVTKSKELTGLGRVLSIGGGIASLGAAAAGSFGSAAASGAAEGTAGEASSLWGEAANEAADATVNQAVDTAAQTTADSFAGSASSAADKAIGSVADAGADSALSGAGDLGGYETAFNPNDVAGAGFSPPTPTATGGISAPGLQAPAPSGIVNQATAPTVSGSVGDAATSGLPEKGIGERVSDWFKKLTPDQQSRISSGALQLGGNAIGGLFQGWSAEQQLELQKEIQAQKDKQYNDSVKNANSVPVIQFKPRGLVNSTKGG